MTQHDLDTYLAVAVRCAREAGALLEAGFAQQNAVDKKSSAIDWVTEHDKASEDLIVAALTQAFPSHGIVAEEGSRKPSQDGLSWYIDPLDGTTNYAHHFPVYSVSIALYAETGPLVAVVFDPSRQELFSAVKGQGAWLAAPADKQRLQVSAAPTLLSSLLATGFPYDSHTSPQNNVAELGAFVRRAQGIRRAGSAALDIAYVAAGRLDGYWEFKVHAWDMAAGRLLVEEAGGRFTQPDGQPTRMDEQLSVLVSNGHIHAEMLAVLAEVHATEHD